MPFHPGLNYRDDTVLAFEAFLNPKFWKMYSECILRPFCHSLSCSALSFSSTPTKTLQGIVKLEGHALFLCPSLGMLPSPDIYRRLWDAHLPFWPWGIYQATGPQPCLIVPHCPKSLSLFFTLGQEANQWWQPHVFPYLGIFAFCP